MNKRILVLSLFLVIGILIGQVGEASAASAIQDSKILAGKVHRITLETDTNTGLTIIIVEIAGQGQGKQVVRISQETALELGLVGLDSDGKPVINELALGKNVEFQQTDVLPAPEEKRHPVGDALATFFFESLDTENNTVYDAIMAAHGDGVGFGVIAQALWLTHALPEGGLEDFEALLLAKETNVYTGFLLADGTPPGNWAELRNAILDGKKVKKLGPVMTGSNNNGNGSNQDQEQENNRDREKNKDKEKSNNGNNPGKDKDKEKK